jgi:flavin-dependent dehydrogenase
MTATRSASASSDASGSDVSSDVTRVDVAIVGGGMAGHTLARQLRRTLPELCVAVFDKSTDNPYKVGESMVEIASNYLLRKLGLSSYLYDHQLPKNGLRFFFDAPGRDAPLHEMSEIGSESLPFHPAFQIDRGRLDADLAEMNARDGVVVRRGAAVRDLRIGGDGAPHRFRALEADRETQVEARWVVDASGRGRLLAKTLELHEPEPELRNAAAWGRFESVADVDDPLRVPPEFRSRVRHTSRRLSTLHFVYPGYWIWFIPLRGITSVGVVCDREVFRPEMRTQEGLLDFVCEHAAPASLLSEAKPVDHGCYMNLAYGTRRFFDGAARWGMTGEAGAFTDPLYSPGSDFIALENDFITDLIRRDQAGEPAQELADRGSLYDAFMRFRTEATLLLYRGQYSLLGSYELCKLKWDFDIGSYYNLWVDAYMRDLHLDTTWLESQLAQRPFVLRTLENFRRLFAKVERELRASGAYHRANLGAYSEGRDCLHFLEEVGQPRDDAAVLRRNGEIFNRVRADAARILGLGPVDEVGLPRFMGRRSIL